MNKSKIFRLLTVNIALAGSVLISGHFAEADAQTRDPFTKPGWAKTRETRPGGTGGGVKKAAAPLTNMGTPAIEQRIEFFKRLRENAAANGQPLPKVTSVLALNEMAVTGIFRTPRGYAAMVEATPIKLSYTIYPGDKFFDGQLVAVEENRLVFRRVTKISNGKFVSSVENKTLRQYSTQETVQGTAPTQTDGRPPETVTAYQPPADASAKPAAAAPIVSPLEEMNKQVPESDTAKEKSKKSGKKPVKVARKNK
ncbi:MAG: hypothetical protein H7070_02185 [Saprospiraceae bacterium]|nr:hypothetical protein [Pyrinomonadaceae bacterium]